MWCILCESGVSQMFLSVSFLTLVLHKMLLTSVCFSNFESLQGSLLQVITVEDSDAL